MKLISRRFNGLLILSICISVLISSFITTWLMVIRSNNEIHEKNIIQIHSLADNLERFFENAFTLNYQLSMNPVTIGTIIQADDDWENRQEIYREECTNPSNGVLGTPYLSKLAAEYSWVELFFVQDSRGFQTARSSGMIGERGARWWFRDFMDDPAKSPLISESYYSMTGNIPVASVFHPIYLDDELIGIMGTDINFSYLQEMVGGYLYSEDLEAIVLDPRGIVVAHPQSTYMQELYNFVENTKSILIQNESGEILQDSSGRHMTETMPIEISDELNRASEEVLKGNNGFIINANLNGDMCSIYYYPAYYPGAGFREGYGVILIHNHKQLIVFTRILMVSLCVFIIIFTFLLYIFFHRLFARWILNPLSVLVDAMNDRRITGFDEVFLKTGDEFEILAETYNELRTDLSDTHQDLKDRMEELAESEAGYRSFAGISLAMTGEKEKQEVLKMIIREGMDFCHSEGGTLYLLDDEKKELTFEILLNDVLDIRKDEGEDDRAILQPVVLYRDGEPNYSNVSSYCALTGEIINIPDVYNADGFDFEGMKKYDLQTGYRSKSMLVCPLKNLEGEIVGVLQLINARERDGDEIIEFSEHHRNITTVMASLGAVTLTNIQLNRNLEEFLYSFIRSIATAVDEKSHYTSGHIERVVLLSTMIAERINREDKGVFADVYFSEDEMEELRIAAWMHDVGKISIPEDILDKSTKLMFSRDGFELIRVRAELIGALWEIESLKRILSEKDIAWIGVPEYRKHQEKLADLDRIIDLIKYSNKSGDFLADENIEELRKATLMEGDLKGMPVKLLGDEEFKYLSIRKGTLSEEERRIVESHVSVTRKILDNLHFPGHLAKVPLYASQHHEKLDGSGYDMGVGQKDLPLQSRIIAVSDIFEALTAHDRPYRDPIELKDALGIMEKMCVSNHIDEKLFRLIVDTDIIDLYRDETGLKE